MFSREGCFFDALSGTNVVMGAWLDDSAGTDVGEMHLFDATTGALLATFEDPRPTNGGALNGFSAFASDLDIDGNFVIIGAVRDDTNGTDQGQAYLYDLSGNHLATYVDPERLAFWSNGPTGVRLGDATIVEGREELFAELPPAEAPPFVHDAEGRPRFHGWNILRKYGSLEAWAAAMRQRLAAWGVNTVANWSHPVMLGGPPLRRKAVRKLTPRGLEPRLPG